MGCQLLFKARCVGGCYHSLPCHYSIWHESWMSISSFLFLSLSVSSSLSHFQPSPHLFVLYHLPTLDLIHGSLGRVRKQLTHYLSPSPSICQHSTHILTPRFSPALTLFLSSLETRLKRLACMKKKVLCLGFPAQACYSSMTWSFPGSLKCNGKIGLHIALCTQRGKGEEKKRKTGRERER
ncbi:hypothetical protein BP00DRAFT_262506 [Aspergillus indologenus CBS 114.80]|uniref:Uncharacterized protein n=1 Tax=Aspergillus indologenus CBS 114.80 TaxID=1450541 RepID=A0A2V5I327_9EURO|nr:hypothetical protein BP00DRAFT_262506 [Aspergillus indologenus CBS 114.80]